MSLGAIRFLVVDDMEVMRKLTVDQLRALGALHIEQANDGQAALKMLQRQPFDLVLADWNMPVMTGIELLRTVRADAELSTMPIIMVTAESERGRVQEAIASGVSELLVKPYTTTRLGDKVLKVLQRSERRKAAELEAAEAARRAAADGALAEAEQAAAAAAAAAAPVAPPEEQDERLTILAVDDTPDNLRLISRVFEDKYRVRLAHNGEKALAICTSIAPPDLLLLDVMMPGMDGFELARQLRAHPNCEHLPIIFVTAMDDVMAQRRGLSLGAVDYITKPIDPDLLQLRVHNFARLIMRQKERQDEYDDMLAQARLREDIDRMLRHDLLGPLGGVAGLAQQLAAAPALLPEHAELAQLIAATTRDALDSIALSAELFKIETGRYTRRSTAVALTPLLQRVVALALASFASKELVITCDVSTAAGAHTTGDPLLYNAVFHNLLKNACEAAPPSSAVRLQVLGEQPLTVELENQGVVPPALRSRLFTKNATSKRGGSGLGTYSARLLLEAQGGSVALHTDDAADRTVVTVTLPALV
ncbi:MULTISPECIES: response regulator [unclassified Duganella]|uniref:hybrid sensor histidine kinase/response regulator n=1 Tax=unclassified Duganella TaxID=2636909 RepID=UPI000E356AD3|nr:MULTISPECIES: response regulator [unclassified Duganella]RFP18727.1 response regulator [Duganella sp. BJB475]RFP35392.1 response regulator [Duganella sp. BJB476]